MQISARFKESEVDTIGIIIDADINLNARWQSIKNILTKQGFDITTDLPNTGLVVENEYQKAGVWIMPDNNTNGMLEDFLSFLVPDDDQLLPIARSTLEEIETKQLIQYAHTHKSKALIHTWLAWQKDPGTPLGLSITKKQLTTDKETCSTFICWLTDLFEKKYLNDATKRFYYDADRIVFSQFSFLIRACL